MSYNGQKFNRMGEESHENVTKRLEDLRVDHDITQIEIAKYLNMNRNVYWRYERGEREIPVWAVIKLAQYYRVSPDYLLGLKDEP